MAKKPQQPITNPHDQFFRTAMSDKRVAKEFLQAHLPKALPLIYPMVVYHGERAYPFSTDINDLVDAPKELVERYFLKPFQLVDLAKIKDKAMKQHAWSGVMEFALKHIFARDLLPYLQDIAGILHRLDQADGRSYVEIVLQYFLERGELSNKEAFFKLIDTSISPEVGDRIMSLAEQLRQEGLVEGEQKGEINLIMKMLSNGVEPAFIAKNTGFSIHRIKELQKNLSNQPE